MELIATLGSDDLSERWNVSLFSKIRSGRMEISLIQAIGSGDASKINSPLVIK